MLIIRCSVEELVRWIFLRELLLWVVMILVGVRVWVVLKEVR